MSDFVANIPITSGASRPRQDEAINGGSLSWKALIELLQRIEDVNTALMTGVPVPVDPEDGPWVTEEGFDAHLTTDYVSDDLGRVIQVRGPWHEVQLRETDTAVTSIRRVEFTAYDDENHETRQAGGGFFSLPFTAPS